MRLGDPSGRPGGSRRGRWLAVALSMGVAAGCDLFGSDGRADGSTSGGGIDTDVGDTDVASSSGGQAMCLGTGGPNPVGEICARNEDCASGVCSIFRDAPRNDGAVCLETPSECATRVTGTVLDFETGRAMPDVPVVIASALEAIEDPLEAEPLLVLHTDEAGRVDGVSDGPFDAELAVLALSATDGYALTATGIAQPPLGGGSRYEVGTGIHDVWLVPLSLAEAWSQALSTDEDVPQDALPLAGKGAVVGMVRDANGQPISGAEVFSDDPETSAIVRVLADDGSMTSGPTGASGMFVVLRSGTPETFVAVKDGNEVGRASAGRLPGTLFVSILQSLP